MSATRLVTFFSILALLLGAGRAAAQDDNPGGGLSVGALAGTGFTYQGELRSGGNVVNGVCDFQFSLWDSLSSGVQQGSTQPANNVIVTSGRFAVVLNAGGQFGARAFDGSARWLAISVRCPAGAGGFTALTPRLALTAAPLALALPGLRTEANATNVVGGHISNTVSGGVVGATISGGGPNDANTVSASSGTIGGGEGNTITAAGTTATIGGGAGNTAGGQYAVVGGGGDNTASGHYATVGGGIVNVASGAAATVGGGGYIDAGPAPNQATATASTVGGGANNLVSGYGGLVSGGRNNTASNTYAAVGGGAFNTASGQGATVPGGQGNLASGQGSFAAGSNARATHTGSWVWACDGCATTYSPGNLTFAANAVNGFWFGNVITGVVTPTLGAGNFISTTTGARLTYAGVWTNASDRGLKTNFAPVDGVAVLNTLMGLPIASWTYKVEDSGIRHLGPTAQDFYAAFGLGDSDSSIGTVDADGVALAAIQGLYAVVQEQQAENAALRERMAMLESGAVAAARRPVSADMLLLLAGAVIGAGAFALGRRRA